MIFTHESPNGRPSARIEFYSTQRGACRERSLAGIRACARQSCGGARGLGLRAQIDLPHNSYSGAPWCVRTTYGRGGWLDCWECRRAHAAAMQAAVLKAMPKASVWRADRGMRNGTYIHLFDGAGTKKRVAAAIAARDAAVITLRDLGYDIVLVNERGGREFLRATRAWRQASGCGHNHWQREHVRAVAE